MAQTDWGNLSLAISALFGVMGLVAYFGLSLVNDKNYRPRRRRR